MSVIRDKRSLLCFFSRTGLTKRVVELIHTKITSDIFEIKTPADYSGVVGWLRGGVHALYGGPQLTQAPPDFTGYDTVFLAGPVWAGRPAPPLIGLVGAADFRGKPVVSLPTAGGNDIGKFNFELALRVKNGRFIGKPGFAAVQKATQAELEEKVIAWLRDL
jgi:flavodoxin